jgi:serine protease
MSTKFVPKALAASALLVLFAGCGGGGGGSEAAPASPVAADGSLTLSGTLSLSETSLVDSDTNDPQQPGRQRNDTPATAQALVTPVFVVGSVNEAGQGSADGANFRDGDRFDYYKVALQAQQTVELESGGDGTNKGLGLILVNQATPTVATDGSGTGCVRIASAGTYFVVVAAVQDASIYNLRIGAPGDGRACAQLASGAGGVVPGEVVARPLAAGTARAASVQARLQAEGGLRTAGLQAALATEGVALLRLPPAGTARTAAMAGLDGLSGRTAGAPRKSVPAAAVGRGEVATAVEDLADTLAYARRLQATGLFAYVEPNRTAQLHALPPVGRFPPNDRLYPNQRWHYEMIGLPAAMERLVTLSPLPARQPVVAVIDSGIVADHPDLAPQIADQASFVGGVGTPSANDPSRPADNSSFHGTHTAGTIAAATFDGAGVAGVAPMARLMPLRVFKPGSLASEYDIGQAILFAAGLPNVSGRVPAQRADVINMSLGSAGACSALYLDVIGQARRAGVIVVASAGNDSLASVGRPANCPGVISVGATDALRKPTWYSNAGSALTVTAPGGDARQSTTGTGLPDSVYSTLGAFNAAGVRLPSHGGLDGTSMAAPHVAGVMALMRYVDPTVTPAQVAELFQAGRLTDDLGAAGRDNATGWGMINARKAVDAVLALKGAPVAPVQGVVEAHPSALDFGSAGSLADLTLALTAEGTEKVVSVVSSLAAVTVSPKAAGSVDAATGLGVYAVSVDRVALPAGSSFATLAVTTSTRRFDVQVSVQKLAAGTSGQRGDVGRVYVVVLDGDTREWIGQASAVSVGGRYAWQYQGRLPPRVSIVAGTDIDSDNGICQRGEVCGAYPNLGPSLSVIEVGGNLAHLDFTIAPLGGVTAAAAAPGGPAGAMAGIRRTSP